jgi:uncharacterized Rossmann fold enzyme
MLQVCTINASNYLGRGVEYTNILHDMVRRNLPEGFEGRFTVFTDTEGEYHPDITVMPLPAPGLHGWWNKLALFKDGVFNAGDRVVYIDLSTIITGRLDDIVKYDGPFAILCDFYRPDGLQSAFMAWEAGTQDYIWDKWVESQQPIGPGGDQAWIEIALRGKYDIWQAMFPNKFVSYQLNPEIPTVASVVKFHGTPKPHEVFTGWVPEVWKIGGMTRAELDNVCNTEIALVHENIVTNSRRSLKWFEPRRGDYGNAAIVGGSPSLASNLTKLRWRKEQGHPIFSTNNTHDYLIAHNIVPDYHVMVDARPENAQFVQHPHPGVHYLIGSQCDPSVFNALEDYRVTLFHNLSPGAKTLLSDTQACLVGGGTTVGMKAMLLAELLGFRNLHLFGMDSCYMEDAHHAYDQPLNDNENIIDLLYEDRRFKVAPWMASQANDFIDYCNRFTGIITVTGDGLLAYIARCGLPENAADTRAREILSRIKPGSVGVEVGVFTGALSSRLLADERIAKLYMVDSWAAQHADQYAESGDYHATLTQGQQDECLAMTQQAVAFAAGRGRIIRESSTEAAKNFADGSMDFVFIDADHSYEGCMADLKAWAPKVKPGGLLCGHDYENTDYPKFGVTTAVDEYLAIHGLTLETGDNFCWFTTTQLLEEEHARI